MHKRRTTALSVLILILSFVLVISGTVMPASADEADPKPTSSTTKAQNEEPYVPPTTKKTETTTATTKKAEPTTESTTKKTEPTTASTTKKEESTTKKDDTTSATKESSTNPGSTNPTSPTNSTTNNNGEEPGSEQHSEKPGESTSTTKNNNSSTKKNTPTTTKKNTTKRNTYYTTAPKATTQKMTIPAIENTTVEGSMQDPLEAYYERISSPSTATEFFEETSVTEAADETENAPKLSTAALVAICLAGIAVVTCAITGLLAFRNKKAGQAPAKEPEYDDVYDDVEYESDVPVAPEAQQQMPHVDESSSFTVVSLDDQDYKD